MPRNVRQRRNLIPPTMSTEYAFLRFRKKLVNTAHSIFEWTGLPDTVNENFLTNELIENGIVGMINTPNGLRAVRGNVGGEIDCYYRPQHFIYANPVLGSGEPKIGENCAVLFLTSEDMTPFSPTGGLSTLIDSTALLLADNMISLNVTQKNTRMMLLASADDEQTANSAERTIMDMYNGRPYKVVNKSMTDSFDVNPLSSVRTAENMKQLIENQQYILAHFYQELGINANFNMKRERLITSEVELNTECLDTLVDDMEKTINDGLKMCNILFGTDIHLHIKRYGEELTNDDAEQTEQAEPDTEQEQTEQAEPDTEQEQTEQAEPDTEQEQTEQAETDTEPEQEKTETVENNIDITINVDTDKSVAETQLDEKKGDNDD
ncbi:MAG: hypothetical protein II453_21230 [Alphaproteobacteria bacterium]|nr:hypothetical protein [Alphaproteobacteria bacterium]